MRDALESQDFYELMQAYRHTPLTHPEQTLIAFNAVKSFLLAAAPPAAPAPVVPLTPRELELIDGMIDVQLHHAAMCYTLGNRTMADRQKGWDMERVALLRKLRGIGGGGK